MSLRNYLLLFAGATFLTGCGSLSHLRVTSADFEYGIDPGKIQRLRAHADQENGENFLLLGAIAQGDKRHGVPAQARYYYRLSAEQGNARAQYLLGKMLFSGRGGARDYDTAFRWFGRAAEQGYQPAQVQVGMMYYDFLDAPPDYINAYKWLTLAGATDMVDQLEAEMTSAQILEAQKVARAWKPRGLE